MANLCSKLIVCALAVGTLTSTQKASAQTGTTIATVNVPFAFQIDGQRMSPGVYRINQETTTLFLLRGPSSSGMVLTHPTSYRKASATGFIAFHRIGSTYFFGGLSPAGKNSGIDSFESVEEKETLDKSANQVPSSTMIAINSTPQR